MSSSSLFHSYAHALVAIPTQHTAGTSNKTSHTSHTVYPDSIETNVHPLYLHNNDQPGMILISKKLVGSENYASWKRSLQIALENSLLFLKVLHYMFIGNVLMICSSMNYLDSACTVWSELSERFDAVSGHKVYAIQRDLFKLEQGNDSVEFYFHKLKGYWDELKALQPVVKCTCGAIKDWEMQLEQTRLIQFLMGLHSSFTAARGHLLMMNPWPSVNQAFMLLKQEEKQRQTHSLSSPSQIAMMVNLPKPQTTTTTKSNERFGSFDSSMECSYCHGKGHLKEKCYKLIGYPADHPYHPNNKGKKKSGNSRF
ncbi:uncharacterized protein LOC141680522 [Apium graveolens]|uniref:uncharacterized protein LOC141680522 n=1 Tax=Apium graveolens TaxID=4045 RepID=UPI003D7B2D2C